jgi:hypothetical protein
MVKCGVSVTAAKGGGALAGFARPMPRASPKPFVKIMSRRHAPGPNFEIVPRDRAVRRWPARVRNDSMAAEQLGPRLQKIYSPCTDRHPDDIGMLIVALDRELRKQ